MKKLVIFDLDGTLIDTLDDLKNSVNFALSKFGYPLRTKEQIRQAIGNGVAKLVERSIPGGIENPDYPKALEIFEENYSKFYKVETKDYEGIADTLHKLKRDGFKLAVCTNKIHPVAVEIVKDIFGDIFDEIQGDQKGYNKKPSADLNLKIMSDLGINKEDAIYVGDTEVDEQTAVNTGIDYVLVSYGFRTPEEQAIKTPDADIVNNPIELYEYLKNRE